MTVARDKNGGSLGIDGTLGMNRRIKSLLSRRASAQVRQVMHAQAGRHFPQSLAAGREESAQQPALAQLLQPRPPALRAAAQPIEDPG